MDVFQDFIGHNADLGSGAVQKIRRPCSESLQ